MDHNSSLYKDLFTLNVDNSKAYGKHVINISYIIKSFLYKLFSTNKLLLDLQSLFTSASDGKNVLIDQKND